MNKISSKTSEISKVSIISRINMALSGLFREQVFDKRPPLHQESAGRPAVRPSGRPSDRPSIRPPVWLSICSRPAGQIRQTRQKLYNRRPDDQNKTPDIPHVVEVMLIRMAMVASAARFVEISLPG